MGDIYNSISAYIIYSVVLGFALGVPYDILRIIRMCFTTPKLLWGSDEKTFSTHIINIVTFVCDIVFMLFSAIVCAIFIFCINNGRVRGIALACSLLGFALYYNSIGGLVTAISELIIKTVYKIIHKIIYGLFAPVIGLVGKWIKVIFALFKKIDGFLFTRAKMLSIIRMIEKDFR